MNRHLFPKLSYILAFVCLYTPLQNMPSPAAASQQKQQQHAYFVTGTPLFLALLQHPQAFQNSFPHILEFKNCIRKRLKADQKNPEHPDEKKEEIKAAYSKIKGSDLKHKTPDGLAASENAQEKRNEI